MNEKISIKATVQQNAYADRKEAFDAIVGTLFFHAAKYENLLVRDNKLYAVDDERYYGSSFVNETEISDNPRYAALYTAVKVIYDYLKNSDKPQWARQINKN